MSRGDEARIARFSCCLVTIVFKHNVLYSKKFNFRSPSFLFMSNRFLFMSNLSLNTSLHVANQMTQIIFLVKQNPKIGGVHAVGYLKNILGATCL